MSSKEKGFGEFQNRMTDYKWRELPIGDTCFLVKNSYSPIKNENKHYIGLEHIGQGTLKLIGIGNSQEIKSIKSSFKSGNILFGKLRPYFRKVYMPNFDGVCSTDIFVIQEKKGFDNKFLFYFFSSWDIVNEATKSSEGTRMPRASWKYLSNLKRRFPPLPEQKAIAKVLSDLDEKIELNNEMNKTLEEIGQALFKRWFIDFEFPDENGNPYRSSGGEMVFSEELGKEIPKGWKVGKLGDLVYVLGGYAFSSNDFKSEGDVGIIKIKNIENNTVNINDIQYVRKEIINKLDIRYKLNPGSIVVAMTGAKSGKIGLVPINNKTLYLNQRVGKFIEKIDNSLGYLFPILSSEKYQMLLRSKSYGSAQPNMSSTDIESLQIIVPNKKIIENFGLVISFFVNKILNNHYENQILSELRDSLLPKLMSGEIRVPLEASQ